MTIYLTWIYFYTMFLRLNTVAIIYYESRVVKGVTGGNYLYTHKEIYLKA